eukprot:3385218-Pleurochrysis_carterae.AAC.2
MYVHPDDARAERAVLDPLLAAFLLYVHANIWGKHTLGPKLGTTLNNTIAVARVRKRHHVAASSAARI